MTVTDQLGVGCDRYNGAVDLNSCLDNALNYSSAQYDFFTGGADPPHLPGGGGYTVRGLTNPEAPFLANRPSAVTIMQELNVPGAASTRTSCGCGSSTRRRRYSRLEHQRLLHGPQPRIRLRHL